jgi:hypothetical protein
MLMGHERCSTLLREFGRSNGRADSWQRRSAPTMQNVACRQREHRERCRRHAQA